MLELIRISTARNQRDGSQLWYCHWRMMILMRRLSAIPIQRFYHGVSHIFTRSIEHDPAVSQPDNTGKVSTRQLNLMQAADQRGMARPRLLAHYRPRARRPRGG